MADALGAVGGLARPIPTSTAAAAPPRQRFGEVLGEIAGRPPQGPTAAPPRPPPGGEPGAGGPARGARRRIPGGPPGSAPPLLRRALVDLVAGQRRMDGAVRRALAGRGLSPGELLALQATVLRHGQEIEAASRIVDRATGAIKTLLHTQV